MNAFDTALIESQCSRLCIAFHAFIDEYRHAEVVALFAPDAVWIHRTGPLRGHAEFTRYLDSKSTLPVTCHIVSNILIDVIDEDHAKGQAYITVYNAESKAAAPPQTQPPLMVVRYHDEFVRTDAGWRFASRQPSPVLSSLAAQRMIQLSKKP